jgi:AmmeMemoRadiSam system protein B/AmmeMemoRadiSam system protein A
MIRKEAVAGQFYPAEPGKLKEMLGEYIDLEAPKEDIIGLLSPHAGYIYSGPVAGATISRVEFKDTFVILGPNHTGMGRPFAIMSQGAWKTPLGEVQIDSQLAGKIISKCSYIEEDSAAHRFEHSIEVQLPFLQYIKPDVKIVPIALFPEEPAACREIGEAIAAAIKECGDNAVIMASSDMSHYEPEQSAHEKDRQAIDAILDLDDEALFERVRKYDISMCGYGPAISLIVAARQLGARKGRLVKYQTSAAASGDRSRVVGYAGIVITDGETSPQALLARQAVEAYIGRGEVIQPKKLVPELKGKAGVFICLKKEGELRGCIGTFEPRRDNIAQEIVTNAISSAIGDPRFPPVTPDELEGLSYSVDVLTHAEEVHSPSELDPKRYGLIVESGHRRGLLLPDLEGVDTPQQQIAICRQKAGIAPDEPVNLYRFEVKRYK